MRHALVHVRIARVAFAYDEELRLARQAVDDARAIGYRPIEAEALTELGEILALVDGHPAAEMVLREAVTTAEAAGDDRGKAAALLALFDVVRFEEKPDLVGLLREQTAAAIARLDGGDELEAQFSFATGEWLLDAGKPAEAEVSFRRSPALAETLYGPETRIAGSRVVEARGARGPIAREPSSDDRPVRCARLRAEGRVCARHLRGRARPDADARLRLVEGP